MSFMGGIIQRCRCINMCACVAAGRTSEHEKSVHVLPKESGQMREDEGEFSL